MYEVTLEQYFASYKMFCRIFVKDMVISSLDTHNV